MRGMNRNRRRATRLAALAAVCVAVPASPAEAGRLMVTGYDPEHHCGRDQSSVGRVPIQCNMVKVGVNYVRAGAPDPSKPVLVLDRSVDGVREPDFVRALALAFGAGAVPYEVVEPRSGLANLPINTNRYSAILIAASKENEGQDDPFPQDLNELNSAPDSKAINDRAADIRAFFNSGGGLFVSSGGYAAAKERGDHYGFLPLPTTAYEQKGPFTMTAVGQQLGLLPADITSTFAHQAFSAPAPESPLKAAVVDSTPGTPLPVVLLADVPRISQIAEPTPRAGAVGGSLPGSTKSTSCRKSTRLKIVLRRPARVAFERVTVFVNGKRVKIVRANKLGTKRRTKPFTIKLRKGRTSRVKLVVHTTADRYITINKKYRICG